MQRLLADQVACEDEALVRSIPERDGEHPPKLRREVGALLLVQMRENRGVTGARHHVPSLAELSPGLLEVVQLAVEDRDDVA